MTTALDNGLWKAADVLRDKGFVKGSLNKSGQVCAIGAYTAAYDKDFGQDNDRARRWSEQEHADEMRVLADTIETLFGDRHPRSGIGSNSSYVMSFNDSHQTTEEDVVKVFRVAAVKLATGV